MGSVLAYTSTTVTSAPTASSVLASITVSTPSAYAVSYVAYYTLTSATLSAPGFPSTGSSTTNVVQNSNGFPVTVVISSGTVTSVWVNQLLVGSGDGTYIVPSAGEISVAYTGSPTWTWTNATPGTGNLAVTTDQDNIALQSDPATASTFVTAQTLIQQPIINAPLAVSHYFVYAKTTIQLIAVANAGSNTTYHVQLSAVYPGPSGSFL